MKVASLILAMAIAMAGLTVLAQTSRRKHKRTSTHKTKPIPKNVQEEMKRLGRAQDPPIDYSDVAQPLPNLDAYVEWQRVTSSNNEVFWCNMRTRLRLPGGIVKAWIKEEPKEGRLSEVRAELHTANVRYDTDQYTYLLTLWEFKCGTRMSRSIEQIAYGEGGSVLSDITVHNAEWGDLAPETIGESLYEFNCRK